MFKPGDIISYLEMCSHEGVNLQKGMNFRLKGKNSVILMSLRENAPYADKVEREGTVLIYEGHDAPKTKDCPNPKELDQPLHTPKGGLTDNGKFFRVVEQYRLNGIPERVRVYEKIKAGIWVFNGVFALVDVFQEKIDGRFVFKFRLELLDEVEDVEQNNVSVLEHDRLIPSAVKLAVWRRDKGRCVLCDHNKNLHFDHVIPFSKGGSSLIEENIQLLCASCNLKKRDRIE